MLSSNFFPANNLPSGNSPPSHLAPVFDERRFAAPFAVQNQFRALLSLRTRAHLSPGDRWPGVDAIITNFANFSAEIWAILLLKNQCYNSNFTKNWKYFEQKTLFLSTKILAKFFLKP
jgi:hypothetical protein